MSSAKELEYTLAWGGYYAVRSHQGAYNVIRLLDQDRGIVHLQPFKAAFDHQPRLNEVQDLSPGALHLPVDIHTFIAWKDVEYIGMKPLQLADLYGYGVYLEQMELTPAQIIERCSNLLHFSQESMADPYVVKLTDVGEDKDVEIEYIHNPDTDSERTV